MTPPDMPARQVFRGYEASADDRAGRWSYCPSCGAGLARAAGGHQRCAAPRCGRALYRNPVPAVSVLVVDGDRFLLCRRHPGQALGGGKWCLPCGHVDFGEDFLTAARREVREETGLEVSVRGLLSVVSNFFTPDVHSVVTVLLAGVAGGRLQAGDDAVDVGWFEIDRPLPELAFEADRHIVDRYYATRLTGAPVDPDFGS